MMCELESLLQEIDRSQPQAGNTALALLYSRAGQLLLEKERFQEAGSFYQQAALLYGQSGDHILQVKAFNQLGVCQLMADQPQKALETLSEAKKRLLRQQDERLLASIEGNIGLAWYALNDYTKAFQSHKRSLELSEKLEDPDLKLRALIDLADCNLQSSYFQPALGFALVALDLARSLPPGPALVSIYDLLGMICSRQGDLQTAIDYHRQASRQANTLGDIRAQARALANQALALEALTELDEALLVMSQARDLFALIGSNFLQRTTQDLERIRAGRTERPGP
jgi:tetratricopeptide (TPR) repeat protein